MRKYMTAIMSGLLLWPSPGTGAEILPAIVPAPPLQQSPVTDRRDLGLWNDMFAVDGQDVLILRRGTRLFSLSMLDLAAPPKELPAPAVPATSRIVAGVVSGPRLWLFVNSEESAPFGIDAYSAAPLSKFEIAGVEVPGEHAPQIQSAVPLSHANAALIHVSGGDRSTWPRDENRPVCFWLNLTTGDVVGFPIGWDLSYFDQDMKSAVFYEQVKEADRIPELHSRAVDLQTGLPISNLPNRRNPGAVPFDWVDKQSVKPIYSRRDQTGDQDYLSGLFVDGAAHWLQLEPEPVGAHYLAHAQADQRFAAFSLRRSGQGAGLPSDLWLMDLQQGADLKKRPHVIAKDVTGFELLRNGNAVLATGDRRKPYPFATAYGFIQKRNAQWDILEAVPRLAPLPPSAVGKSYVEDRLTVRFIGGFGSASEKPRVLCLFQHYRKDSRNGFPLIFSKDDPRVARETWRHEIIVDADGNRFSAKIFEPESFFQQIWFHRSGKVITTTGEAAGQIRLTAMALRLEL